MQYTVGRLVAVLVAAAFFAKLMYDMTASMREMTGHVAAISRDVGEMRASVKSMSMEMAAMRNGMERMEASMRGMGRAFEQGSEQFQQWNPGGMMKQMVPGQRNPTR
jgi:methyl-accepting chemotaxis protein